ncbi:XK-related protein 8 [Ornithorhynchus anatinus]|uniref:XK-related protein n=1 Tax=Ornithorhynchus anatinus TaxID=9258 RepID=A0A6I8NIW5_ORNAN|nr:XK-related protein 8 [Ornithorhynchus anatinus]
MGCAAAWCRGRCPWEALLTALGTAAFVVDAVADVWAAGGYVREGRPAWALLLLAPLLLSSLAGQLLSWAWHRADPPGLAPDGCPPARPPPRLLALCHLLQLGYLARCVHALRVEVYLWRKEKPSEVELAYAAFLSLDISLLRLFETFLETAPQLTLVLIFCLQAHTAQYFQWAGICTSLLCASWALLDYHRSLRSCLEDKHPLDAPFAIVTYFLWNLLLLAPRLLALALLGALAPGLLAMHFVAVWLAMLLWVCLQGTDFMGAGGWEGLYRAVVAVILYFSWFNVAEGRTVGRSTLYYTFMLCDSTLLVGCWLWTHWPLPAGSLLAWALPTAAVSFAVGLGLRGVYYWWLHPRASWDEVDFGRAGAQPPPPGPANPRMATLARSFYSTAVVGPA